VASWQAAPSIVAALTEANERWPRRSRRSDGVIGDAAHSARVSDHNPDDRRIVHAFDLTHDPVNGPDASLLVRHLIGNRDPRLRYVIHNGVIWYGPGSDSVARGKRECWSSAPYTGVNAHKTHLHVSIAYSPAAENDRSPWFAAPSPAARAGGDSLTAYRPGTRILSVNSSPGTDIAFVQRWTGIPDDGHFGPVTLAAVQRYQRMRGLTPDGIVGPRTWGHML
jgi:peptidoglycan hydrolase-like protein with peptidoglycan-binding domain